MKLKISIGHWIPFISRYNSQMLNFNSGSLYGLYDKTNELASRQDKDAPTSRFHVCCCPLSGGSMIFLDGGGGGGTLKTPTPKLGFQLNIGQFFPKIIGVKVCEGYVFNRCLSVHGGCLPSLVRWANVCQDTPPPLGQRHLLLDRHTPPSSA